MYHNVELYIQKGGVTSICVFYHLFWNLHVHIDESYIYIFMHKLDCHTKAFRNLCEFFLFGLLRSLFQSEKVD